MSSAVPPVSVHAGGGVLGGSAAPAAVELRWSSGQAAKVELQDFNPKRERTDDRRKSNAGRTSGEGWRRSFFASGGRGGAAIADGERRRRPNRRRTLRAQRRAHHLAQRLP